MFDFFQALQGIEAIPKLKDTVIYDDRDQFLYFDFGSQAEDRKVVKAPSSANKVDYNNTISGTGVRTVQEALDQIYMALGWGNVDIYADDSNLSMIINGGFANDSNNSILLSSVGADDENQALIVIA